MIDRNEGVARAEKQSATGSDRISECLPVCT